MTCLAPLTRVSSFAALVVSLTASQNRCSDAPSDTSRSDSVASASSAPNHRAVLVIPNPGRSVPPSASPKEQREFMLRSARAGWSYVSREATAAGFIGATKNYQYLTVWDMASTLAAAYSARQLGFISAADYRKFVDRTLTSMEKLRLYDNIAYNRLYSAETGAMVDSKAEPSAVGMGWSALDHGRLLIWLKLIANSDPVFAPRAAALVARLNMNRLVKGGYMRGEEVSAKTGARREYQEGRVGYEQYAAEGFALWGAKVDSALDFGVNGKPVVVSGQTLITDVRGGDVMTSEPFVNMGLELGWKSAHWRNLALSVLKVQEARYKQSGIVTMVSEDAIPVPPAYFYYYLLYHDGRPFVVTTVSGATSEGFPRWVSAKAAFGFHTLAPSSYTWLALQTVKYGGSADGWTAGVFEGTKQSTKTFNLNTAAIVLESAAYSERGRCPFIERVCGKT